MSKSILFLSLSLLIFSNGTAFADQYEDCVTGCQEKVAPCVEQARLNAGNIQEEQDSIAACEKGRADCVHACSDAETKPYTSPQEQLQNQEQPQTQEQPQSP